MTRVRFARDLTWLRTGRYRYLLFSESRDEAASLVGFGYRLDSSSVGVVVSGC